MVCSPSHYLRRNSVATPHSGYTVFIIEDDQSVRDALSLLLGLRGYAITVFADAESFLKAYKAEWRGCMLIDIRMPGMTGLDLQRELLERRSNLPAILMTAHGDVASAREAFRSQAVDFLEKPLDYDRLIDAIEEGFSRHEFAEAEQSVRSDLEHLLALLTPRERQVMDLVVQGFHNREIAKELSISARTVEVHKARMMAKLGVTTVADLVRLSLGH